MNEIKGWFETESPDILIKSLIDEKHQALTGPGDRLYKRKNDWQQLEVVVPNFQNSLNQQINRISEEHKKLTSKQSTYLNQENIEELNGIIQTYNDTLNNAVEKLSKALKIVDPPVSHESLQRHLKDLNDVISFLIFQKVNKVFNDAEKRVKDEIKRLEKEKKDKEEKEKKEKEAASKGGATQPEVKDDAPKNKTGSEMEVD